MIASDDEAGWEKPTCDEFTILKTLGEGKTSKVKLASAPDGKLVAVKRFKEDMLSMREYIDGELKFMQMMDHPNILKLLSVRQHATYTTKYGEKYQCFCIIIEYSGGGDLFEYVSQSGPFKPNLCRTYFLQLMHGLQHIHSKGICHRDMKLENVLLSETFTLQIADFGFATYITGQDNSPTLKEKLGTQGYMAPEIITGRYGGKEVDIFACGVILFILYSGNPPFQRALVTDPFYKTLKEKQYSAFWDAHSKNKPVDFFTDDFKDLFQRMMAYKPEERIKLEEILEHEWCLKTTLSDEKIIEQMKERKQKIKEVTERIRKEKEEKRNKRHQTMEKHIQQGKSQENIPVQGLTNIFNEVVEKVFLKKFQQENTKQRQLRTAKKLQLTDYVIEETEAYFFSSLDAYLEQLKAGFCFPMKFGDHMCLKVKEYHSVNDQVDIVLQYDCGGAPQRIDVRIEVQKTKTGNLVLGFHRRSGLYLYYKRFVDLIKQQFCYCHVRKPSIGNAGRTTSNNSPKKPPKCSSKQKPSHSTDTPQQHA